MQFNEQLIKGVWEIRLSPIEDSRGFFMRTFEKELFKKQGLNQDWVQENHSLSSMKGTLRGLHFQFPPYTESKLIRCVRGEVFDAFVDLRLNSISFGKWGYIFLSDTLKNMALIPRGFAHGYCTLTDNAEVIYKVDNSYSPEYEGGLKWDDPEIGIEWPIDSPVVSMKDSMQSSFATFVDTHTGLNI